MIVISPLLLSEPIKKKNDSEKSPSFLGVRNEAVRDSSTSSQVVQIEVRGVKGSASGSYRLAYLSEAPLSHYLGVLNLKNVASKSAVYDYSNLEKGRCRLHYVPSPGARIVIGPPSYGPALEWQRCNHDVNRLMENMGSGNRIVEKPV